MSAYQDWIDSLSEDEVMDKIEGEWPVAEYAFNAGRPKWISVDDRLPGTADLVLCYEPSAGVDNSRYEWVGSEVIENKDFITHWMPLPEPPQGD